MSRNWGWPRAVDRGGVRGVAVDHAAVATGAAAGGTVGDAAVATGAAAAVANAIARTAASAAAAADSAAGSTVAGAGAAAGARSTRGNGVVAHGSRVNRAAARVAMVVVTMMMANVSTARVSAA